MKSLKMKQPSFLLLLTFSIVTYSKTQNTIKESDYRISKSYANERKMKFSQSMKNMGVQLENEYFYHLRMGWLFYLDKKFRNSVNHYTKAISLRPNSINATLGKAESLARLGLDEDAINLLYIINKKSPSHLQTGMRLIDLLVKQSKEDDAYVVAEELYTFYPENLQVLRGLVKLSKSLKKDKYDLYKKELDLIVPPVKI